MYNDELNTGSCFVMCLRGVSFIIVIRILLHTNIIKGVASDKVQLSRISLLSKHGHALEKLRLSRTSELKTRSKPDFECLVFVEQSLAQRCWCLGSRVTFVGC